MKERPTISLRTRAVAPMEMWGKVAQRIRVPAGTLLGVVFLFLMHPTVRSLWIGGVVAAIGAGIRVWAAGHIDKGRVLTRGGPYAWTRNPLYLGSFLMALGVLLAGQAYWLLLPFAGFFAAFYYPVMKAEEQELLQGHGQEFLDYVREVPLILPGLRRFDGPVSTFSWRRVIRNREHRTLLGLLLIETFLTVLTLAGV